MDSVKSTGDKQLYRNIYIQSYLQITMTKVEIKRGNLILKDNILGFIENEVKSHGTSARVNCPKRFIGKRAYVIIIK